MARYHDVKGRVLFRSLHGWLQGDVRADHRRIRIHEEIPCLRFDQDVEFVKGAGAVAPAPLRRIENGGNRLEALVQQLKLRSEDVWRGTGIYRRDCMRSQRDYRAVFALRKLGKRKSRGTVLAGQVKEGAGLSRPHCDEVRH